MRLCYVALTVQWDKAAHDDGGQPGGVGIPAVEQLLDGATDGELLILTHKVRGLVGKDLSLHSGDIPLESGYQNQNY